MNVNVELIRHIHGNPRRTVSIMTIRILRFAPLLALAAAPIVHAANSQACSDETVTAVARWAGIASARIATRDADRLVAASACKVMPNAPETTIAAVAFDSLPKSKNPDESSKLQVVALVEGGKVVAAERSVIQEDAAIQIGENSYRIDTAPYRLSPDVRAFGVVFSSTAHGPSCPDAYMENELTLWIREGARIRPVFGTNLNGWVATTGTACGSDTSDLRSESARMTIAVEKTSHNGFADLSITAHVMNAESNDDKQPDAGKRTVRTVVKYDGKSYGSDMYRDFWYSPASKKRFK